MKLITQKLSIKEKVGYSLGDLSANLVFQTLMMFLLVFYTDIYKIPAGTAGTIIGVGGIIGAVFNFAMGAIADRTRSRWGKFRPWILWTALPFGLLAWLAFLTPDFSPSGKIIYASITYLLLLFVYSANNLPYSALSGVMTGDMLERTSLSSYRFVAVMSAQFISQVLLLPLVLWLGGGNEATGYKFTIGLFSIVAVIFFIITFLTTRERITPDPQQKTTVKQDMLDLLKNRPWIMVFIMTTFLFISLALRNSMLVYYFNNFINEDVLIEFLQRFGVNNTVDASASAFSLFNAVGIVTMIVGILFSKSLTKRFGKRDVFIGGIVLSSLLLIVFKFLSSNAINAIFITQIIYGLTYGVTIPLLWAMVGDVADYSEWKNKRRATGIVFSAMLFGLKAGLSIGGAIAGYILSIYGYQEGAATQSASAISGIQLSISIYPAMAYLIGLIALYFYEINKSMEFKIQDDLESRRNNLVIE